MLNLNKVKDNTAFKMIFGTIMLLIVGLIIYTVVKYVMKKLSEEPLIISDPKDGKVKLIIDQSKLAISKTGSEYTYSFWIYVDDWDYKFGKPKHILHKGSQNGKVASPAVWFYPKNNNLMVRVDTYNPRNKYSKLDGQGKLSGDIIKDFKPIETNLDLGQCLEKCELSDKCTGISHTNIPRDAYLRALEHSGVSSMGTENIEDLRRKLPPFTRKCTTYSKINSENLFTVKDIPKEEKSAVSNQMLMNTYSYIKKGQGENTDVNADCDLKDLPLQRWVHVSIVLWNTTLDMYLNGKLRRSCTLDSVPKINKGDLYINQDGGFKGKLAGLRYYARAVSPEEIYGIYISGHKGITFWDRLATITPKVKLNVNVNIDVDVDASTEY